MTTIQSNLLTDSSLYKIANPTLCIRKHNTLLFTNRMRWFFTNEELNAFINIRKQLDCGQVQFEGSTREICDELKNHMAFQLIYFRIYDLPQPFRMVWKDDREISFVKKNKFDYAGFLSKEGKEFYSKANKILPDKPLIAEARHFAQFYLRDNLDIPDYPGIYEYSFFEGAEHIHLAMCSWINYNNEYKSQYLSLPFVIPTNVLQVNDGHYLGSRWASKIVNKLNDWVYNNKISLVEIPQYARLFSILLTLVDFSLLNGLDAGLDVCQKEKNYADRLIESILLVDSPSKLQVIVNKAIANRSYSPDVTTEE